MSDFLATLAARIRPAVPPIEPRRSSLFESPAREAPSVESTEGKNFPPTASAPSVPAPAAVEAQRLPAPPFQPAPVPAPGPSAPAAAPPGILPFPPPVPAPVFTPARAVEASRPFADPAPEKISIVARKIPPAPPPSSAIPVHSIVTEKIISVPAPPPVAPTPGESRQPLPRAEPLLAPPAVRLIEPAMRASAQAAREREPAEPSAIHVTIGRVEVRAVVPPAPQQPAPPARKPSPVIPLDDYLRQQRSRGARA